MGWKNEKHFEQRHTKHDDHHDGHRAENLAECTCDEKQGSESSHSRQDTNGDRTKNPPDTAKSCGGSRFRFLLFRNNVLANDDGIVHDDAKHDDQCKQRDHVDIDPKGRKEK